VALIVNRWALEAGFDGYVPKPVNLKDLMGAVREMAG
jgi:hypothetical protein